MKSLNVKKPIIIVGAPRSGTTLLLTILSESQSLWTSYRESTFIRKNFYTYTKKPFKNDLLSEEDFTESVRDFLLSEYHKYTFNNYFLGASIRKYFAENNFILNTIGEINHLYKMTFIEDYKIVEKSPKTCFQIPFLNRLFPDCKFIYLMRDGRSNISSLIEGWNGPEKYKRTEVEHIKLNIKGYSHNIWKFILPPGWEEFKNSTLEEVTAFQWARSNKAALEALKNISNDRKYFLRYEDLIENPAGIIKSLCTFCEIPFCRKLEKITKNLPEVNYISKPNKDKWKKNMPLIETSYSIIEPIMNEMGYSIS